MDTSVVPSSTRKLLIDGNRHTAVLLSQNEDYRYLLRVVDSGIVDIERLDHEKFSAKGWRESLDPLGPWKWANTFARSTLVKSQRAARLIEEIKMEQNQTVSVEEQSINPPVVTSPAAAGPTMQELVAEYKRLTGREVKGFKSRAAGIAAIEKASKLVAVSTPAAEGAATTEESEDMRNKRTKGSKRNSAGAERTPRGTGAKATIRTLFSRKGAKVSLKEIQKACKGISPATVNTTISDLKNPKYAGAEGTLVLQREMGADGDVVYKRVD